MSSLDAELQAAVVRALYSAYLDANGSLFQFRLRPPTIAVSESTSRLGCWIRDNRRLEVSERLLLDHGWGTVVEVLRHEMAHQYVDEVLGLGEEGPHGPTFRRVCDERGIDPQATGLPQASAESVPVLERIAKLLALAESPNEHEAQAAMKAAQRLMLKYNIDEVTRGATRGYSYRHLGRATGRVSEHERILANILATHFFVDAIWVPVWRVLEAKRGSMLEVVGAIENLEMAEYVHTFLTHTADRLWKEHKREHGIRGNRDRRAYLAGVMAGFRDQLDAQRRLTASEGLVWSGDPELQAYFRRRHPRVRWTRHASSGGSEAHRDGRRAGRQIVLHRGVKSGPTGGPNLLGS